jgi:hypothetical protein
MAKDKTPKEPKPVFDLFEAVHKLMNWLQRLHSKVFGEQTLNEQDQEDRLSAQELEEAAQQRIRICT